MRYLTFADKICIAGSRGLVSSVRVLLIVWAVNNLSFQNGNKL